jgi:hypothetical protein
MTQSAKASVAGLYTICQSIYAGQSGLDGSPVLVVYGPPGSNQPEAIVGVGMSTRQPITRPTMGTNRSRETLAEIDVVISVWQSGAELVQQYASEKCFDLVDLLQSYFRTVGQETLSGGCMDAWVSNVDGPNPTVTYDAGGNPAGRSADATVTVTARIRY